MQYFIFIVKKINKIAITDAMTSKPEIPPELASAFAFVGVGLAVGRASTGRLVGGGTGEFVGRAVGVFDIGTITGLDVGFGGAGCGGGGGGGELIGCVVEG